MKCFYIVIARFNHKVMILLKIKEFLKKNCSKTVFEPFKKLYELRFLMWLFSLDLNADYRDTVIISGSGRSGTTWVANILNYDNQYRYMFEPFNPFRVARIKKFGKLTYLKAGHKDKRTYELVGDVLSGKIKSLWINKYNRKCIVKKRLIKEIHINILLKWIKNYFPEIPIILLLRHPFAVAYSKTRLSWWNVDYMMKKYLSQKELVEDFLEDKLELANNLKDDFSKFIFIWCLENIVPISQFKEGEIHLAFYENFCQEPEAEIKRMFDFLGKDMDGKVLRILRKPSAVSRNDSAIIKGRNLVNDWKDKLTEEQIHNSMNILKAFGLDKIYSTDTLPNIVEAYKFLQQNNQL